MDCNASFQKGIDKKIYYDKIIVQLRRTSKDFLKP